MHIFELERGDQGLQSLGHGLCGIRVYDEDGAFFTHFALWTSLLRMSVSATRVGELPSEKSTGESACVVAVQVML